MLQQSTVKKQILLGDTAYGTLDARDTMESQNVVPVAPLPMGRKKVGHFGKHEFVIDFIQNSCRCPAGKITTRVRKKGGQNSSYVFLPKTCNRCELRDQCTKHGTDRVVGVHPEEERRCLIITQTETEKLKTLSSCIHCGSRQSKTALHNCQVKFMRIAAIENVHGSRLVGGYDRKLYPTQLRVDKSLVLQLAHRKSASSSPLLS